MDGQRYRCKAESFNHRRNLVATFVTAAALWSAATLQMAQAQQQPAPAAGQKPNILIIFGDDIGVPQISAYTMGMMGYKTPNIDRIAREKAPFSPTATVNKAARRDARRSSSARSRSAPAS